MGSIHRTDGNSADREPRTGDSGSRQAGTAAGAAFNPSLHDIYWRDAYLREPYYKDDYTYGDYAPAYRTGYESAGGTSARTAVRRRRDRTARELRARQGQLTG